ncbi:hypothetical protein [uncultured Ferrovibrio sp.]|uniref:hypothetical protein n=1 Tax=uncultured Ferrovibrio sp. TaxID=1576913 RepID=UPI00260C17BB|nr:hypothetical protein [uncultured Ferrovibrio sp.]
MAVTVLLVPVFARPAFALAAFPPPVFWAVLTGFDLATDFFLLAIGLNLPASGAD